MSGENDDLFSPPGGLLFGDITGNGDDLDFTKDFFSDDISTSTVLNGSTYEDMGGDDLIADLSGQDDFPRLGGTELSDSSSFGVNVEPKATTPNPPGHSQQQASHTKPFANGQVLPAYGNFQKPSINLAHMNSGYGGCTGVQDMYMSNNAMRVIPSPTSPATPMKSSGMLSPGATSERLNCLSLDQMGYNSYRPPFDINKGVVRGYGMNGGRMNLPGSPAGDKRFCSSPLSSPTVQASSNSSGISPFATGTGGGQEITSGGEIMQSPSSQSLHSSEAASPRGVGVSTGMESKDGGVVADGSYKMQVSKPMFMSASGLAHRLGPSVDNSGFVPQVDSSGDGLRPLPSAISARPPIMQRSYSSHALGQLRTFPPPHQNGDQSPVTFSQRMAPLETPSRLSNGSSSPHLQPQLPELQNIHMRPLMQSMRRVHSTGDIQTLNGMAGGASSPSSLDRSYEEGGMKIGRYTMEERKIRIHRYQQKRTQRNFNKKIKYACRKTLADSRPRVRGRFAKNDEVGESLMKAKHEDEDEEEVSSVFVMSDDDDFVLVVGRPEERPFGSLSGLLSQHFFVAVSLNVLQEDLMFDEENSYIEDEPLGDISDLIGPNGVKLEHPPAKGVKLEQPHPERNQLLQT